MHIISRRVNEGVMIGDDIHVTVLEIREDHLRVAISSPNLQPPYQEKTLHWDPSESAGMPREELQVH